LARLPVDRASGALATHKPLLLLVVLDLAEQGLLPPDELELAPELAFHCATGRGLVAARRRQRADVRSPFFHLKSDGCWRPWDRDRQPAADFRTSRKRRFERPGFSLSINRDSSPRQGHPQHSGLCPE
jgi:hypothetical protein